MKFKPEDFGGESVAYRYAAAEKANALLEKWLAEADIASGSEAKRLAVMFKARYLELKKQIEEAPVIYGSFEGKPEFKRFGGRWWKGAESDTHRARLVRIEELKDE